MRARLAGGLFAALLAAGPVEATANAAAAPKEARADGEPSREEIEAWLESRSLPADIGSAETPEAPPAPPREPGWVLEGGVGALGHAGALRRVSPPGPWFHLKFGWEPARWVMIFAQGDTAFANTSLTSPPPPPRGYALWAFGAGARVTWDPADAIGLFLQPEIGAGKVSDPVLGTYGFTDADSLGAFFGAMGGVRWYQINPHYALVAMGGVRYFPDVLTRRLSGDTPLAWVGSLGLAYTFF